MPGLVFGVLMLTWLVSGLLSLNPWGLLEGRGFFSEVRRQCAQATCSSARATQSGRDRPRRTCRQIRPASSVSSSNGRLFVTAWTTTGEAGRASTARRGQTRAAERTRSSQRCAAPTPAREDRRACLDRGPGCLLLQPPRRAPFPGLPRALHGWRALLPRRHERPAELMPSMQTGAARAGYSMRCIAATSPRSIRARPIWDIMMWLLMGGVTIGAATGTWLGVERIARALRRVSHRRAARARATA